MTFFRLRRFAEARGSLEKAVGLRPDYFGSDALLGATYYMLKEDDSAYNALDHANRLNPADADTAALLYKVAVLLGRRSSATGNYHKAETYLERAAGLQPSDSSVARDLGEARRMLARPAARK